MRHAGDTAVRARGRDVHDTTPARVEHVRDDHLAAVEGPREVDLKPGIPLVERDLQEALVAGETGVVDQNRRWPKSRHKIADRRFDHRAIRDVDVIANGGQAPGSHLLGKLLSPLAIEVE